MVDIAEVPGGAVAAPVSTEVPQRPQNVPLKFWQEDKGAVNVDALLGAYAEAEKRIGSPAPVVETPKPLEVPKAGPVVEGTGIFTESNMTRWAKEVVENSGQLTANSYAELAKAGIPRPLVDIWIQNNAKVSQNDTASIVAEIGGEEAWGEVRGWAGNVLSPEEKRVVQTELDAGGARAKTAVKGLEARYRQENGTPAERRISGAPASAVQDGFRDMPEMIKAMSNPKYKESSPQYDPAYRRDVMRRAGVPADQIK